MPSRIYRYRAAFAVGAFVSVVGLPVQAGLLAELSRSLGLLPLLSDVSVATGLALDDAVIALDGSMSTVPLAAAPAEEGGLGMSPLAREQLAEMDAPARRAVINGPLAAAGDQPALQRPAQPDPRYRISYIQARQQDCVDGDGDGICDRDDQCRSTPPQRRVMANGCHLDEAVPLRLDGVNFDTDSWQLSVASRLVLDRAAAVLQGSPLAVVEIAGHTDARGTAAYNLRLSERRAGAVMQYLQAAGIAGERLRARGYGESQPLRVDDYAANRRVELRLLSN
ncbi:OmpA family protein [Spongiibacter sp.]|uniref:OmpA family protein n=1 Tax=Spongiibacter sp. TaxID=2024860 RepID=UPI003569E2BD